MPCGLAAYLLLLLVNIGAYLLLVYSNYIAYVAWAGSIRHTVLLLHTAYGAGAAYLLLLAYAIGAAAAYLLLLALERKGPRAIKVCSRMVVILLLPSPTAATPPAATHPQLPTSESSRARALWRRAGRSSGTSSSGFGRCGRSGRAAPAVELQATQYAHTQILQEYEDTCIAVVCL